MIWREEVYELERTKEQHDHLTSTLIMVRRLSPRISVRSLRTHHVSCGAATTTRKACSSRWALASDVVFGGALGPLMWPSRLQISLQHQSASHLGSSLRQDWEERITEDIMVVGRGGIKVWEPNGGGILYTVQCGARGSLRTPCHRIGLAHFFLGSCHFCSFVFSFFALFSSLLFFHFLLLQFSKLDL
jgi:hypothetical protein